MSYLSRALCVQSKFHVFLNKSVYINIDHMQQNKMTLSDVFLYNGMYHFVLSTK